MARPPASDAAPSTPQRLVALLRATVPPVHPAGYPFIGAGLVLAAAGRRRRGVRSAGLLAAAACAGFFRHPDRVPPGEPDAVVAPADGTVCVVDTPPRRPNSTPGRPRRPGCASFWRRSAPQGRAPRSAGRWP